MADEFDNPLDDELLKELGLEPKETPSAPKPPAPRPTAPGGPAPGGSPKAPPPSHAPSAGRAAPSPKPASAPAKPPAPSPASQSPGAFSENLSHLSDDMPVQVVAVLGKRTMTLKDVIDLKQGEIIELKKLPQEPIDLVANGKLMARGELVVVDGKLGIQIKQLVG